MLDDKVKNIKLVLRDNDIANYFRVVIGADVVKSHKPHPEGLSRQPKK